MQTLTARWVFPVDQPLLERGTVTIADDKILAVEPAGRRAPDRDLGDAAILPGLVNAHTHLDLSHLRGTCPPTPDFTAWLRDVIRHRRATSQEETAQAVADGLQESIAFGVTLMGDISANGASWNVLKAASVRAVVFKEVLGLGDDSVEKSLFFATKWVEIFSATATCRPGLSPHAPYSVHFHLFRGLARLARENGLPLATHLAETREELLLLDKHSGAFVPFLKELGVWNKQGLASSAQDVIHHSNAGTPLLFAHGNYLRGDAAVLPANASVIYCPRTHAAFGHDPHPLPEFLKAGVRVALGTDSLASNPDLDLLAEARFVRQRFPQLSGEQILRLATLAGAEALGWHDETGSLTPGKSADLIVLPIAAEQAGNPHDLILASNARVRQVMCRGRWIMSDER